MALRMPPSLEGSALVKQQQGWEARYLVLESGRVLWYSDELKICPGGSHRVADKCTVTGEAMPESGEQVIIIKIDDSNAVLQIAVDRQDSEMWRIAIDAHADIASTSNLNDLRHSFDEEDREEEQASLFQVELSVNECQYLVDDVSLDEDASAVCDSFLSMHLGLSAAQELSAEEKLSIEMDIMRAQLQQSCANHEARRQSQRKLKASLVRRQLAVSAAEERAAAAEKHAAHLFACIQRMEILLPKAASAFALQENTNNNNITTAQAKSAAETAQLRIEIDYERRYNEALKVENEALLNSMTSSSSPSNNNENGTCALLDVLRQENLALRRQTGTFR
jgi:hypothetical protein